MSIVSKVGVLGVFLAFVIDATAIIATQKMIDTLIGALNPTYKKCKVQENAEAVDLNEFWKAHTRTQQMAMGCTLLCTFTTLKLLDEHLNIQLANTDAFIINTGNLPSPYHYYQKFKSANPNIEKLNTNAFS